MSKVVYYSIYYPGGNTTALVEGMNFDQKTRRVINDLIMQVEPDVEQVGFYSCKKQLELQMAGGEFCGNAARSVAMTQYTGQSFASTLLVSGLSRPIKVGVDDSGLAWSEVPVTTGLEPIQKISETMSQISLEGITHVVVLVPTLANVLSAQPTTIKRNAYQVLEQLGLTGSESAAGVIYVETSKRVSSILPVVWVRDIQTLFVETACGSGSMAVALQQAVNQNKSLSVQINQPSGEQIEATVTIENQQIVRTTIRGAVRFIKKEKLYAK